MNELVELTEIISSAKNEAENWKSLFEQSQIQLSHIHDLHAAEKSTHAKSSSEHSFLKEIEKLVYPFDEDSTRTPEDRNLVLNAICAAYKLSGQKSLAQRTIRDLTGWSLRECQDYVDIAWGIKISPVEVSLENMAYSLIGKSE
jgi:hypothetical protein